MRFGDITQITNAIPSWTQWTRENLDPSEDIPDIDWTGHRIKWDPNTSTIINTDVEVPWQGSAWALFNEAELQNPIRDREELLTCFADELNHNLRDAAARFTALHFYYAVATCASLTKEEEIAHVRKAFMDDLKTLVGLAPVEKCQNDWRTIKWEILNSYVIRDWERARQLYDHAELVGALDELDLQLLRGHFNFLLVYDKENKDVLNSLYWELGILHPNYKEGTFAIYNIAVLNGQTKRATLTGRDRDRIRDARNDLEKALDKNPNVSPAYRAMLARCYADLEEFSRAAENYQMLLGAETVLVTMDRDKLDDLLHRNMADLAGKLREKSDEVYLRSDFKPRICFSIAKCFQLGGQLQKAEEALRKLAEEYPHHPGIHLQFADIQAQEGRYHEAYESLRREVERDPALEERIETRIALALGGVKHHSGELPALAKEFLKRNPQVGQLVDSLQREYWPPYANLTDQSREEWRVAVCLMHYFPFFEPTQKQPLLTKAAEAFSKALELELRTRVFGVFRVYTQKDPDLSSSATEGLLSEEAKVICEYLKKKGNLTLGSMCHALDRCRMSNVPVMRSFDKWIEKNYAPLLQKVVSLRRVVELRNFATHETLSRERALDVPRLCREVLESIVTKVVN